MSSLSVLIASNPVTITTAGLTLGKKLDQRTTCSFTILDLAGTGNYSKGQPVTVNDSVQGTLFTGYLQKPSVRNLYPQTTRLWSCTCLEQGWLADKRTTNTLYPNQYAGVIAADQVSRVLAAEGVTMNAACDFNHQETDWQPTEIYGTDTFARANQSGWGTATDGHVWTQVGSGAMTAAISYDEGQLTAGANSDTLWQLGTQSEADVEALMRLSATSFNSDIIGPALRIQNATNWYRPRLYNGYVTFTKMVAGVVSTFGQVAFTATSGASYWLRYRVVGTNHYLKAWQDGTSEPVAWMVTASDSSITAAGGFGVEGWSAIAGDIVSVDHYTVAQAGNVVATSNTGDGNVGDGDLELALAGTPLAYTDTLSSGTYTNVQEVNGALMLSSTSGLMMVGTASQGTSNPYSYVKIWTGSYTIQSGDALSYQVWIASTSPAQEAGVDGVCSDGTTLRDFNTSGTYLVDQQYLRLHPATDLSGFATDTWYARTIDLSPLAGKTLSYMTTALEGNSAGDYTAYFRQITIENGGTTQQTIYESGALVTNEEAGQNAYSAVAVSVVTVYELAGSRISNSISLSGVGIAQSSQINWVAPPVTQTRIVNGVPVTTTISGSQAPTLAIETSLDGGATWQNCTNYAALPALLAGAALAGVSLLIQQAFALAGADPTLSPTLTSLTLSIQPSYVSAKVDVMQTEQTNAQWNAGSLSALAVSNGEVTLNNRARDWHTVTDLSDQTLYGVSGGSPFQRVNAGSLELNCIGPNYDARSRQDWAGNGWNNFTATVSFTIGTPVVGLGYGLEYRGTVWSDALNSFAWCAKYYCQNTSGAGVIQLSYGTNSSGGGAETIVSQPGVTLSSGSTHTLMVMVSGATHQVYLDDTLYINVTNATYQNNSGYVGVRFYNNSSADHSGLFSDFGLTQALTGTYETVAQSLAAAGTLGASLITWQETDDPSGQTYLVVSTSTNGGATWQTATNGGAIPSLTVGQSLTGVSLVVQVAFSSPSANLTPVLSGLTIWVQGAFSSSGTWISPALSLAPLGASGRIGASLVNWNATLAGGNTTIAIDTSVDGGASWQTIGAAGDAIPNLTVAPAPTSDTFATNTSANYTSTAGHGGAAATWTWNTASSQLEASGGTKALLLLNGLGSIGDIDLFCDLSEAENGGLCWHYVDSSDFYYLAIQDAGKNNQATLFKMSAGVVSQLSQVSISFPVGTYRRVRITMLGNVITCYFDGVQIISYTDTSPLAAGQCGLFSTNGTSLFYQFSVAPQGQLAAGISVLTKAVFSSTDATATPQLLDCATLVSDGSIGVGALVPSAQYQGTYASANLDDLKKQSDYSWQIDEQKQQWFLARAATPAPWIIASANSDVQLAGQTIGDLQVSNLSVDYSGDLYRNREVLTNVQAQETFVQAFVGDGTSTSWTLDYPVAIGTIPVLSLNASAASLILVGIKGQTSGKDYYYTPGGTGISQDSSQAVLTGNETLIVTYTGTYTTTVTVDNTGGFPGTVSQSEYAAIDGTSGIIEHVTDCSASDLTRNYDVPAATAYGKALLQEYGVIGRTLSFDTYRQGLAIGQQLPAFLPAHQIQNAQLLVTQITTTAQPVGTGVQYKYRVVACEGPVLGDWVRMLGAVFS